MILHYNISRASYIHTQIQNLLRKAKELLLHYWLKFTNALYWTKHFLNNDRLLKNYLHTFLLDVKLMLQFDHKMAILLQGYGWSKQRVYKMKMKEEVISQLDMFHLLPSNNILYSVMMSTRREVFIVLPSQLAIVWAGEVRGYSFIVNKLNQQ